LFSSAKLFFVGLVKEKANRGRAGASRPTRLPGMRDETRAAGKSAQAGIMTWFGQMVLDRIEEAEYRCRELTGFGLFGLFRSSGSSETVRPTK
jgi:hypothetical protein